MRGQEETARPTGRITDGHPRLGVHDFHHRLDQRTRREVLPGAALGVFGVLLQQAFVDFALDVDVQSHPGLFVDQGDQALELGRVLDAVLRLAEDDPQHAAAFAERSQRFAVVDFQIAAIPVLERRPGVGFRDDGRLFVRRLGLLIGHFQEEQIGQLLDVIAVTDAVIAQYVAVVPETLDDGGGLSIHMFLLFFLTLVLSGYGCALEFFLWTMESLQL